MPVRPTGSHTPVSRQSDDDRQTNAQPSATPGAAGRQAVGGPLQDLARRRRPAESDHESGRGVIETDSRFGAGPSSFQSLDSAMASLSLSRRAPAPAPNASNPRPTRPPLHRNGLPPARAPLATSTDPRDQLIEGAAAPSWQQHMFQGFDAVMNAAPASLDAALASAPQSAVLSQGDHRPQAERDRTANLHQARPRLGLDDLQTDRASLGTGTPAQIARAQTYIPRLAQAEGLIRTYVGQDDNRDERALPPFRALAQAIGTDAAADHEDNEKISAGDYLKILDQVGVMFRRVPDDD